MRLIEDLHNLISYFHTAELRVCFIALSLNEVWCSLDGCIWSMRTADPMQWLISFSPAYSF